MRRTFYAFALGALALALAGCGSQDGPALARCKGKVIYKDKGVADAMVTFHPDGAGVIATGTTDKDGVFTLSTQGRAGAKKGNYKVIVAKSTAAAGGEVTQPKPEDMIKMYQAAKAKGQKGYAGLEKSKSEIPSKYATLDTSKLTATVSDDASQNNFEFTLVD